MTMPLVTVAICTYNAERYLALTLDSVQTQTYTNMEIVLVDDGSRDNTLAVIERYASNDSRIRWFAKAHEGLPAARSFAFAQSRGEWIAIIDADDICYPERLSKQTEIAQTNPSAGLVFCDTHHIDSSGNILRTHLSQFDLPPSPIPKGIASSLLITQGCYVDTEACFIRRSLVDRLGAFDESLRYACDYDYFIRAGLVCDFAYTRDVLAAWRRHPKQMSVTDSNSYKEGRAVMRRYLTYGDISFATRLAILRNLGKSIAVETYHGARKRFGIPFANG